ncbi:unnamed protein product [Cylicocyclus nassatus]|uniref:Uncharacterized protein n=1 Tax=Cylicocyclus nassatus TaxID=53992 RepID=A0AA36HCM9_CYLNA|nr:unnamed protein product [Cylicocyclus nassatus]
MILLLLAFLYSAAPVSTKSLLHFYGPSDLGVIHDDRPTVPPRSQVKTTTKTSIDEVVALNLPQTLNKDPIVKPKDEISKSAEERKLPILRAETEAEAVKPAVQPQTNYVLMGSTNQQVEPQRQILHAAEVLDVGGHSERDRQQPQSDAVLRNSLTHVEMIPTDVVPVVITTTATSLPTADAMILPTPLTTSYEMLDTKAPNLSKEVEEKRHEMDVDELPKAKMFSVKDALPNVAKDELLALDKEEMAKVVVTSPEPLTTVPPLEQKSKEDEEDVEVLPDFDEKGDVELEFHDESDVSTTSTTPPTIPEILTSPELPQPSTTVTATAQDLFVAPTDISEKDYLSEDDVYNLLMFVISLLPDVEEQPSTWSKIIAGLQCALRDCRRAFPYLTTVPTPVGNGTFIIRRARGSECICTIDRLQLEDEKF